MTERRLRMVSILGLLAAWQVAGALNLHADSFVPSPLDLVTQLIALARDGYAGKSLLVHIVASLQRSLLGFSLGVLVGVPVGLLIGRNRVADCLLSPIFGVLRPLPTIALIPLFILFFGIGEVSKVLVIFFTSFYYMVLNTAAGAHSVSELLLKAGRGVGLEGRQLFIKVVLPASLPFIMAGLRVSGAISWALLVASELVAAQAGLGFLIMDAGTFFRIKDLFVGIALIGFFGLVLETTLVFAERRIVHWRGK